MECHRNPKWSVTVIRYVKPANLRTDRKDRRLWQNKSGKREVVVIVRERDGGSLPAVFKSEAQALNFIRSRVAKGTVINADESNAWNNLHSKYEMKRINHEEAYSLNGACTNMAESFFSRIRRDISVTVHSIHDSIK